MNWEYDGAGSWKAASLIRDGDGPLHFHIDVTEDGKFDVSRSDNELLSLADARVFPCLVNAQMWCSLQNERLSKEPW